jgi:lysophospholipase L1-like esterase
VIRWAGVAVAFATLVAAAVVVLVNHESPDGADQARSSTVFLGDSLTRGISAETLAPSAAESWGTDAVTHDRSPWLLDSNAGVPGDTLAGMRDRFQADVIARDPDGVVIMGGTNDVLRGIPTEESVAALREMVDAARSAEVKVWLVAPPPLDDGYDAPLSSLVEAERALADDLELAFADPTELLAEGEEPWETFDGVHPTVDGARQLADAVLGDLTDSRPAA